MNNLEKRVSDWLESSPFTERGNVEFFARIQLQAAAKLAEELVGEAGGVAAAIREMAE